MRKRNIPYRRNRGIEEKKHKRRKIAICFIIGIFIFGYSWAAEKKQQAQQTEFRNTFLEETEHGEEYIKWVDFKVTKEALQTAYEWDLKTYGEKVHIDWIELLALTAARGGGEFEAGTIMEMEKFARQLCEGDTTVEKLQKKLTYYPYYKEAYSAVLDGYVGEFEKEEIAPDGSSTWKKVYGLKAYSPIAAGFDYQDYDDFGASRSYGYERQHLGHDMMGLIGTPIIAIESGVVEALGWNEYGGWRIGIRSFDSKRYYYYAHLRQDFPYVKALEKGSVVTAGDVIGYMGHTGYSKEENVNNIETVHLHLGIELIFNEKEREKGNEIWIDCYQLVQFLYQNRSLVKRDDSTKEWYRVNQIKEPSALYDMEKK